MRNAPAEAMQVVPAEKQQDNVEFTRKIEWMVLCWSLFPVNPTYIYIDRDR